ncbi:MAG: hypothetical protein SVY53_11420 [Chloroflexota bacterium]|nr:hypothetical protein [Chloroflexota bacterium]
MSENQIDRACGNCENYAIFGSERSGTCRVIPGDKPGQRGRQVLYETDANNCDKYQELTHVYTDHSQAYDIQHLRALRHPGARFEETSKADRLVFEKHSRDEKGTQPEQPRP